MSKLLNASKQNRKKKCLYFFNALPAFNTKHLQTLLDNMNMDITEQVNIYILAYVMDTTHNNTLI